MSSQAPLDPASPFRSTVAPRAPAAAPATRPALAELPAAGAEVDARQHVEPGTVGALACVLGILLVSAGFLALGLYGAFLGQHPGRPTAQLGDSLSGLFSVLMIALVLAVPSYFAVRKAKAILRATALRVGPRQFPEIHACASEYARRLGLSEPPEVYVLDASMVNAFALKFKKRSMIVLTDETVAACLEGRSPGALGFVIAHELAHVALGHTRWWRLLLRRYRKLSRLDECSADNVACELVGSREAALDGVLLLSAGPRLLSFVDRAAALEQAAEVADDRTTARIEHGLTHPLTLRRLDRIARRFGAERVLRAAA